jgi:hypothetical protein
MKLTDEQLVEFYKGSTDRLMERMKEYYLYAADDDDDDDDEMMWATRFVSSVKKGLAALFTQKRQRGLPGDML